MWCVEAGDDTRPRIWAGKDTEGTTVSQFAPGAYCKTSRCTGECPSSFAAAKNASGVQRFTHFPLLSFLTLVRAARTRALRVQFLTFVRQLLNNEVLCDAIMQTHKRRTGFFASAEFNRLQHRYGACKRADTLDLFVSLGADGFQPHKQHHGGEGTKHSTHAFVFEVLSLPEHMRVLSRYLHVTGIYDGPEHPVAVQAALSRVVAELLELFGDGRGA